MQKLLIPALIAGCMLPLSAYAQRDGRHFEKDVLSVINKDHSSDEKEVEKALSDNSPAAPNDNGLPRFALVGKDKQFYLGIGAQFLGEGVFDWGDRMPSITLFTPSSIVAAGEGNRGRLGFGWQSSSVYLNFVAMPGTDNQVGLFFKGNFMGNNNSFNCYHFYAKYRGLTVGYTTGVFTDASAEPVTLDFEGPNGYPYSTLFNASWTQKFTDNISGAIGIDAPSASMTQGNRTAAVSQRVPAIPLYLQYGWDGGNSHVRLSGLVRPMQYRNLVKEKNTTDVGLGVQLSGVANVAGGLDVQFNAAYGSGIGSYLQDDSGLGLDAVGSDNPGELSLVRTMGLTAGLSYAISPKVSTNLTYSHLTNWLADEATVSGSQYRYGDYVAANVIYSVNRFLSVGVEYDYGQRKSFDGAALHTNRLQCQVAVTF